MDSYLQFARDVLLSTRQPLSVKEIIQLAYGNDLVPTPLYGKTQDKTLQARLSVDIVNNRELSLFFRTGPGRFFLRELLTDPLIPEQYRQPFQSKRRFREYFRGPSLAIERQAMIQAARRIESTSPAVVLEFIRKSSPRYVEQDESDSTLSFVSAFVCVVKSSRILSYRVGRYRDGRDSFQNKRSIGFSTRIAPESKTLFSEDDYGILDAGLRVTQIDLDMPVVLQGEDYVDAQVTHFVWSDASTSSGDLLAVIEFKCPDWFEPLKRRLALNDPEWIEPSKQNNLDDFDPWSRAVLRLQSSVIEA